MQKPMGRVKHSARGCSSIAFDSDRVRRAPGSRGSSSRLLARGGFKIAFCLTLIVYFFTGCGDSSSGVSADRGNSTLDFGIKDARHDHAAVGSEDARRDQAAVGSEDARHDRAEAGITDDRGTGDSSGPPPDWSKGMAWVRDNPMFISGLTVSMGPPPSSEVTEYFDTFHANAVHLWEDGLPGEVVGWQSAGHPGFRFVSWVHKDGNSNANGLVIGGHPPHDPQRIGYQVGDEPRNLQELYVIEGGVNAVRAADPDALIIVNFGDPDNEAELEPMLHYFGGSMDADIISYDRYALDYDAYERLELYRRIGLQYKMPYFRYLNAATFPDNMQYPSESDMRWNAFIGLLYGYTGHSWFVYQISPAHIPLSVLFASGGDWTAPSTEQYGYAAQINLELANLGRAIALLTSTDVRYIPGTGVYGPAGTKTWSPGAGSDPYITSISPPNVPFLGFQDIAVGFFKDTVGETYVMIQNVNHANANWPVDNTQEATIRVDFDFTQAPTKLNRSHVQVLVKETGVVADVSLTPDGTNHAFLQVTLPAGDPLLFKYATGSSFARQ